MLNGRRENVETSSAARLDLACYNDSMAGSIQPMTSYCSLDGSPERKRNLHSTNCGQTALILRTFPVRAKVATRQKSAHD